jgi:RimJ/RimL family protein N-acetyltransferase
LIDGCGAQRVVAAMLAGTCRLRDARHTDAQLVWHWANDPDVRKVSFFSHVISWPEHAAWFRRRLAQRDSPYYIAIDGYGRPWGQIRFDRQGSDAILSILLAPAARGQNRSVRLVQAACRRMFQCTDIATITALVITHNERSLRLFSAAGFTEMGEIVCHAQRAMRFQLARMCSEDGSPSPKLPAESAS